MIGSIKKAMVVAAVAAVGALAPAVASADVWKEGGTTFTGAAQVRGALTLTLPATGTTTSCNIAATADLTNTGGVADGTVNTLRMSDCTTNAPNCTVTMTEYELPWSLTTNGTDVTLSGILISNLYGGGVGCALNGVTMAYWGSTTGVISAGSNAIVYSNATGVSSPFGPQTVSGSLDVTADNATGAPVTLAPQVG